MSVSSYPSLTYLSVCSGIEAATVAWHSLGWTPLGFAEIDKFPSAVLAYHYPEIPNYGDFTQITLDQLPSRPDILVGGTPCQDFSVAGLRAGMGGVRGQLTIEFVRLAERLRTRWLVWENVPGVLSADGGRAFGTFLGALGKIGYGFAYRVLDAQYFGVPQRRRRVFLVGHLGDWRRAAAVLFERQSLSGDSPPRREARQGAPRGVEICVGFSGESDGSTVRNAEDVARPLTNRHGDPGFVAFSESAQRGCFWDGGQVTQTLDAVLQKGQTMPEKNRFPAVLVPQGTLSTNGADVAHSPSVDGFDALEDGTGRGTPLIPIAFSCKDSGLDSGDQAPTLRSMNFDQSHANAGGQVAVAFNLRGRDGGSQPELDPDGKASLRSPSGGSSRSYVATAFTERTREGGRNLEYQNDLSYSLNNPGAGGRAQERNIMTPAMAVRRLLPEECELLQGFSRGYTKISDKTADGPRYKALGNSMAVPCMAWIGRRIQLIDRLS